MFCAVIRSALRFIALLLPFLLFRGKLAGLSPVQHSRLLVPLSLPPVRLLLSFPLVPLLYFPLVSLILVLLLLSLFLIH